MPQKFTTISEAIDIENITSRGCPKDVVWKNKYPILGSETKAYETIVRSILMYWKRRR